MINIGIEAGRFWAKMALTVVLNEMILLAFLLRFLSLSVRLSVWKSSVLVPCSFVLFLTLLDIPGESSSWVFVERATFLSKDHQ